MVSFLRIVEIAKQTDSPHHFFLRDALWKFRIVSLRRWIEKRTTWLVQRVEIFKYFMGYFWYFRRRKQHKKYIICWCHFANISQTIIGQSDHTHWWNDFDFVHRAWAIKFPTPTKKKMLSMAASSTLVFWRLHRIDCVCSCVWGGKLRTLLLFYMWVAELNTQIHNWPWTIRMSESLGQMIWSVPNT